MERDTDMWRDYVVSIDCPQCEAKAGEHCFVKPGMHLLNDSDMPVGFHGMRLINALKHEGNDAKFVSD